MHGGSCLSFESGLLLCAESTLVVDGNLKMTLHDWSFKVVAYLVLHHPFPNFLSLNLSSLLNVMNWFMVHCDGQQGCTLGNAYMCFGYSFF